MKKSLLFFFILLNNYILCMHNSCSKIKPCTNFCTIPKTEPVVVEPQCDRFNDPVCITYPKEGQVFLTNGCISGCALCICNNGFSCSQRVLKTLNVRGTTSKPHQVVSVVLINTKMSTLDSFTFQLVTTSTPAPDGTGVWSVTFTDGITTPKPAPFSFNAIPTTISVSINSDWVTNYVTRSIFIKKDKTCDLDCDLVCRRNQNYIKFCALHVFDSLTKAIKDKYSKPLV